MKSYFAKLADRATLPNVPAISTVYTPNVSDPFETQATETTQVPTLNRGKRTQSPPETRDLIVGPAAREPAKEQPATVVQSREQKLPKASEGAVTLGPKQTPVTVADKPNLNMVSAKTELPESTPTATAETSSDRTIPSNVELTPTPSQPAAIHPSQKTSHRSDIEDKTTHERIAELEQQSLLLHKADDFMRSLIDARLQPVEKSQSESIEAHTAPQPLFEPKTVNRLEPVRRPLQTTPQDSGESSLVIGKLIVEVTPPASPAAATEPPRTIVRRPGIRSSGAISSRRFGLGQF